jgi:hypothetical protein
MMTGSATGGFLLRGIKVHEWTEGDGTAVGIVEEEGEEEEQEPEQEEED